MGEGDTKLFYLFFELKKRKKKFFTFLVPQIFPIKQNIRKKKKNITTQTGKLDYGKVRWQKSHIFSIYK